MWIRSLFPLFIVITQIKFNFAIWMLFHWSFWPLDVVMTDRPTDSWCRALFERLVPYRVSIWSPVLGTWSFDAVPKKVLLVCVLSQMKLLHILLSCFFKLRINMSSHLYCRSSEWSVSLEPCMHSFSLLCIVCILPIPSFLTWPWKGWQGVWIMKLLSV